MYAYRLRFIRLALTALLLSTAGQAKTKKIKAAAKEPQDEIKVVGHLPLTGGPITRFLVTQHYSSTYLYAEHDAGSGVTLVDVTKMTQPVVLADMAYPVSGGSSSLFAVAGTAAIVSEEQGKSVQPSLPQTIRLMDFSDPQHPKVAREFSGVTAISTDRGLIFVANPEGLWILRQSLAQDPEVEKAYAHQIQYQ
jgi:hypothetical protein